MKPRSETGNQIELIDLLDPSLGIAQRAEQVERVSRDPQAALELRLLLALESSAQELAVDARQPATARTPWLRMALPVGAAALMLLVWPQQRPAGSDDAIASTAPVAGQDALFNVSFEAGDDAHFGGGFE